METAAKPRTTVIKKPRAAAVVEDAPLPMPESAGAPPPPADQEADTSSPFRIFVSYVVGKDKYHSLVLNTPFEEIDSVETYSAVLNALGGMHGGKRITPIFFKSFES